MKWTGIAKDYLTFTRKERIGILTILSLLITVIFLPVFITSGATGSQPKPDTAWITAIRQLEQRETAHKKTVVDETNAGAYQYDLSVTSVNNKSGRELLPFDPNSLSDEGWKKLGLRDKTIQTIQNYLARGGRFNKSEDLQRIYGLYHDEYERLAPYIKIETKASGNDNPAEAKTSANSSPAFKNAVRYNTIDINIADTTAFISLPGIGSKLATRIINFREKLGGFNTVEQVKETFGLPDSTFQKIKPYLVLENVAVKKININVATIDELKAHPYISYNIANAIVAYRNQHGPFLDLQDLKKIMIITDELFQKISPYLLSSN